MFNFIKTLTFRKLLNYIKINLSYFLSALFKKQIYFGLPFHLSFEPTNYCNLQCPECPTGMRILKREKGFANLPFFQKLIDQVSPHILTLILYFQGEPFLHPNLTEMIAYAVKKSVYTIISTNAQTIDENLAEKIVISGLQKLIISMDGNTEQTYKQYRVGGKLEKVKNAIKYLVNAKKKFGSTAPYIEVQFIVFAFNEHEIKDIQTTVKELGADKLALKTAQLYDFPTKQNLLPKNSKFARYEVSDGQLKIKSKLPDKCYRLWYSSVVTWDGIIVPCCYDKDAHYQFGDLKLDSFSKILTGKKAKEFRSNLLLSRKNIDICKNCIEGIKT